MEYQFVIADVKFGIQNHNVTVPYLVVKNGVGKRRNLANLFEEHQTEFETMLESMFDKFVKIQHPDKMGLFNTVKKRFSIVCKRFCQNVTYLFKVTKMENPEDTDILVQFVKKNCLIKQTSASTLLPISTQFSKGGFLVMLDESKSKNPFPHIVIDEHQQTYTLVYKMRTEDYILVVFGE